MSEKYLNIPEKIHVGFSKSKIDKGYNLLSYVTYLKKDGSIAKEKSFNDWIDKTQNTLTFDNTPIDGISIMGGGGGKPRWGMRQAYCQIMDPRGFEFQITYDNLLFILSVYSYNIDPKTNNGKFDGKFVYAWDGVSLVLLPVVSQDYEFTKNVNEKVAYQPKECIPGYYYKDIKSDKKDVYIYLGKLPTLHYKTKDSVYYHGIRNKDILISSVNRYIFVNTRTGAFIDTPSTIASMQFIGENTKAPDGEFIQSVVDYYQATINTDDLLMKNFKGCINFDIDIDNEEHPVSMYKSDDIPKCKYDIESMLSLFNRDNTKDDISIIAISKDKKTINYFGKLNYICVDENMKQFDDWKQVKRSYYNSDLSSYDKRMEFIKAHNIEIKACVNNNAKTYIINNDGTITSINWDSYYHNNTNILLSDIIKNYDIVYAISNTEKMNRIAVMNSIVTIQTTNNINIKFPDIYV